MKNHGLWMVISCTLPLLLIFILPVLGVKNDVSMFILIIFVFVIHLSMMRRHYGNHGEHNEKRREITDAINIKRFGFDFGATFALLYLGCVFVMSMVGKEEAILFFNSLMHGIDVTSIIRMDIPLLEMVIGIIEVFILGWLLGATISGIYNLTLKKK